MLELEKMKQEYYSFFRCQILGGLTESELKYAKKLEEEIKKIESNLKNNIVDINITSKIKSVRK